MSTELALFVADDLSGEERREFLLGDGDIKNQIRNRNKSLEQKIMILSQLPSTPLGSTRYTFSNEFPEIIGSQPAAVTQELISAVRQHASACDAPDDDSVRTSPNPSSVIEFLEQNRGSEVFISSVSDWYSER